MMSRNLFFGFFVIFSVVQCIQSKGYYTIVGSDTVQMNSDYHALLFVRGFDDPLEFRVGIKRSSFEHAGTEFDIFETVLMKPNSSQVISLKIGDVSPGLYTLYAVVLRGHDLKYEAFLQPLVNQPEKYSIFLQTDKSVYKPGDTVKFRVLFLDKNLKAVDVTNPTNIFITDAKQNRIKNWKTINVTKGVFSSELPLSSNPNLGLWNIEVESGNIIEKKSFDVDEYVLPKFDVIVDAEKHPSFNDDKITVVIRSKYTYGKPVKGSVTVSATPTSYIGSLEPVGGFARSLSKTIPIDGKAVVEFELKEFELHYVTERDFIIEASVEEALTGRQQNATGKVSLHQYKYTIAIKGERDTFKAGLPFDAWVIVKHHDGTPVQDTVNKVLVYFDNPVLIPYVPSYTPIGYLSDSSAITQKPPLSKRELTLDSNGMAKIELNLDEVGDAQQLTISARYLDVAIDYFNIPRDPSYENQYLKIKLLTEQPQVGEEVSIEVQSTHPFKYFVYHVVGRGGILDSKIIDLPNGQQIFKFKFTLTFEMFPKVNILVYYINELGEIVSDQLEMEFPSQFPNPLKINLSKNKLKPGENIDVTVETKPNSFVGLLGVDQSTLLLKSGNDLNQEKLLQSQSEYRHEYASPNYDYPEFTKAKTVILTNINKHANIQFSYQPAPTPHPIFASQSAQPLLNYPAQHSLHYQPMPLQYLAPSISNSIRTSTKPHTKMVMNIRKEFPETWLWDDIEDLSADGTKTLHKKVPDTITSWIITGFAIDPITGFGMTKSPSKFDVFQPFFVSTNLPYSIKRGETVAIPIVVFNYMNEDVEAEVTLDNSLQEFEFAEISNEVEEPQEVKFKKSKMVHVKANNGASTSFMVRPKKVGYITIKVIATSPVAGDGVERQLLVEPEGVTQHVNKGFFADLREKREIDMDLTIDVPENAVPDSTKIEFLVMGTILGPTIQNLDKLISLPSGCGEQNMLNFVPNIAILDYLIATNKLSPVVKDKSMKYMEQGYQGQLSYKHPDGSYSAFGVSDPSGSTWLTAFVAKSFRQAEKYISIDEDVVNRAFDWLSKQQAANGSFPEVGKVVHKGMQGGGGEGLALTAYVVTAFLQSPKDMEKYKKNIDSGINYLLENINHVDDSYSYGLTAYALQLAKHPKRDELLKSLESKAVEKDGYTHWEKPTVGSDIINPYSYEPNSVNVELSSYGLLTQLEAGSIVKAIPTMKWLITQRNKEGGFSSTQDSVVGIGALAKMAGILKADKNDAQFVMMYDDNQEVKLKINEENSDLLQSVEIPSSVKLMKIKATGQGYGTVQISYKYNLNNTEDFPRFKLNPQVLDTSNKDYIHLKICTSYVPNVEDNDLESSMAVMEVKLPSGFSAETDSLSDLKKSLGVRKVETKESDTVVVMYFDKLDAEELCPIVTGFRTHKVANQKPAPVTVYDYYDNSRRAREFYKTDEATLCDICEGVDCGDKC